MVWLSATRTAKLLPHLWTRPQDIIYVPAFILFGYYFAVMKLYALCTLHEVGYIGRLVEAIRLNLSFRLVGEPVPASVTFPLRRLPSIMRRFRLIMFTNNGPILTAVRKIPSHHSEITCQCRHTTILQRHRCTHRGQVDIGDERKKEWRCKSVMHGEEKEMMCAGR